MPASDPRGLRFGEAAAAYERGRPEYSTAIVDWLLESGAQRVIDLGAGTGKLTRALLGRAETVVAIEPDPAMRRALRQRLATVAVLDGRGEAIPLQDGYADLVVVGQAWHWIDPARGSAEVARVLRPGGCLGLVWNDRDEADPWIRELSRLLDLYETSPDAGYEPKVDAPFGPFECREVPWTAFVTVDGVVDMVGSRSYVIALDEDRQSELLRRVRVLAESALDPSSGTVPVRYVTRGYLTTRP